MCRRMSLIKKIIIISSRKMGTKQGLSCSIYPHYSRTTSKYSLRTLNPITTFYSHHNLHLIFFRPSQTKYIQIFHKKERKKKNNFVNMEKIALKLSEQDDEINLYGYLNDFRFQKETAGKIQYSILIIDISPSFLLTNNLTVIE